MRDELERERGHIALDRGHLEKRQLLLQDEVSERAAEFIKCKKEFVEEERETKKEIEILEKKLNELKKKQSDLLAKIQLEEDKIMAVSKELSSEHLQLEEEQDTVVKKEKELQEKVISLNQLQLSYGASLELHNRNTQSIQLVVNTSEEKLAEYCNNQQSLEEVVSVISNWTFTDISELMRPTESMHSLLDNEKLQEDKVGRATAEVMTLQTNIASCCKKITDQETQLQKLQETKKIAVTARQYREAAKLSAEEKQLSLEISDGRQSVSKMEESLSEKNDILLKLNSELDHMREEREMAEKQADIKCINELVSLLTDIKTKSIKHLFLQSVFDQWSKFVTLIIDDLCIKHGLQLSDYITNTQEAINSNDDDDDTSIVTGVKEVEEGVKNGTHPPEERTPGVGMEVPGDRIVAEIRLKIEEIGKQIAVCCAEEKFDEAADLNDELDSLKAQLTEQLSSH